MSRGMVMAFELSLATHSLAAVRSSSESRPWWLEMAAARLDANVRVAIVGLQGKEQARKTR